MGTAATNEKPTLGSFEGKRDICGATVWAMHESVEYNGAALTLCKLGPRCDKDTNRQPDVASFSKGRTCMKRSRLSIGFAFLVAVLLATATWAQTAPKKSAAATKPSSIKAAVIDINTASKAELSSLSGIGDAYSQKIIDGRPYKRKDELVSKKIVPQATYDKIKDLIVAKQPKK
jgi:DNA uptake protein ComE-like DNA-binding protein